MIKIVTAFILLALLYIPIRPPEPTISFVYDPNQVNYEIIEAIRHYPNSELHFVRKIVEPDGQAPTLTFSDPTIVALPAVATVDPDDPNGVSKILTYDCYFPVNRPPGIYYVDMKAQDNDPNEPMEDNRTILIWLWPKNRPPVIR